MQLDSHYSIDLEPLLNLNKVQIRFAIRCCIWLPIRLLIAIMFFETIS